MGPIVKGWSEASEFYRKKASALLFESWLFDRSEEERRELRERAQVCQSMAHLTAHFAELSRMSKGQPP